MLDTTTVKNELLEAALAYAARGWPVFPVQPRGKKPLVKGGFHSASIDPAVINSWWKQWPQANIGMPTGEASGMYVLDIDAKRNGDETLTTLEEKFGKLPDTPMSLTGGGGKHYFFQHSSDLRNTSGHFGVGIDTRGEGGYVVLPPSVHERGATYEWELSCLPEDTPLAPLPAWLLLQSVRSDVRPESAAGNLDFTAGHVPHDGTPVLPGSRNNAAASLAGQYVTAGDSAAEVFQKLKAWNRTNPSPLPTKEIAQITSSVVATHCRKNPSAVVAIAPEPATEIQPVPARRTFPPHLLKAPGIVGVMADWMNRTAYMPQPELALGTALAFCGTILGRKVQTLTNLRTNFYVLGVADSGAGKDHSRQSVKRLIRYVFNDPEIASILGGEDVSSDSAILEALSHTQSKSGPMIFLFDEIGHMIASASSWNAGSHIKAIPVILTKLFSSAGDMMPGKEYSNRKIRERQIFHEPHVCLYGTTVPNRLANGITPDELRDGFMGRLLVFQTANSDPTPQKPAEDKSFPDELIAWTKYWYRRERQKIEAGNLASDEPTVVQEHPEATEIFQQFSTHCIGRKIKSREQGFGFDAIWARTSEHAKKIALCLACSECVAFPIIMPNEAAYACELSEFLTESLIGWVIDCVGENEHARAVKKVFQIVKSCPNGITSNKLTRRTQWLTRKERESILADLLESEQIERHCDKAKTKPVVRFCVNVNEYVQENGDTSNISKFKFDVSFAASAN